MCGLVGICFNNNLNKKNIIFSRNILKKLIHRGPDEYGEYKKNNVFLGMRRLSIQGIQDGHQPFISNNRKITLIANGEIYNYLEIKKTLIKKGYKFKTSSDCEVLIALYFYYGLNFLTKVVIRGMFAFILYDEKKKILVSGRDRFGEKPLYYYSDENQFILCSEMRVMVDNINQNFTINKFAIDDYFHFGFINEPNTMFKEIKKVEAGTILILNTNNRKIKIINYSNLDKKSKNLSPNLFNKKIEQELLAIGKITTRSEAKIGIALSGGLDSTLIAAISSKHKKNLQAINVIYENSRGNEESVIAKKNAKKLGIDLITAKLTDKEMLKNFKKMVLNRDEPISDISGSSYYKIMQLAKKKLMKVIILGQGGDELFWGYPWLKEVFKINSIFLKKSFLFIFILYYLILPKNLRPGSILVFIKNLFFLPRLIFLNKKIKKNRMLFYDYNSDYYYFSITKKNFYDKNFYKEIQNYDPSDYFQNKFNYIKNTKVRFLNLIFKSYLLQNGLVQADRLSMSQSVEARLPLLDYKFTKLCINNSEKINSKNLIKKFIDKNFPSLEINKKKVGFEVPDNWSNLIFKKYQRFLKNSILKKLKIVDYKFDSYGYLKIKFIILEIWLRDFYRKNKINKEFSN